MSTVELRREISNLRRCRVEYAVDVAPDEMLAVARYEGWYGEKVPEGKCIDSSLKKVRGLDNIEWNGHFGPSFFFRLDSDFDTPKRHAQILTIIRRHIDRAMKKVSK